MSPVAEHAVHPDPAWLGPMRTAARAAAEAVPLPSRYQEGWGRLDYAGVDLAGIPAEEGSVERSLQDVPSGLVLTGLRDALREHADVVRANLERSVDGGVLTRFAALNAAGWRDGLFCLAPRGRDLAGAARASTRWRGPGSMFPRTVVVAEPESRLTLVEEWTGGGAGSTASGHVQIHVKEGAAVTYVLLQRWSGETSAGHGTTHFFVQNGVVERGGRLITLLINLGGGIGKGHIATTLAGSGAESVTLGLSRGRGRQQLDLYTLQDHEAPNTQSDLFIASALSDQAHAGYRGLIRIAKTAQKSNGYMTNRNLLLSEGARADSTPELEILADDVRCSHASATGALDQDQMFYLLSRGLPAPEAERLLIEGFLSQVLARLPDEALRDDLLQRVLA